MKSEPDPMLEWPDLYLINTTTYQREKNGTRRLKHNTCTSPKSKVKQNHQPNVLWQFSYFGG